MIPYAPGVYDDEGYGVRCPACGLISRHPGRSEDAITKGAMRRHQEHWAMAHTIEAARSEAAVRNARDFGTDPSWYGR